MAFLHPELRSDLLRTLDVSLRIFLTALFISLRQMCHIMYVLRWQCPTVSLAVSHSYP